MSDILPSVSLVNGILTVSSLEIAERFGKAHKDVLRAIQTLIDDLDSEFSQRNFAPAEYTDEQGKPRPMYHLTRDAFSLLAMGFTGKKALEWKVKYIEAFNLMEAELQKQAEAKTSRKKAIPASAEKTRRIETSTKENFRQKIIEELGQMEKQLGRTYNLIKWQFCPTSRDAGFTQKDMDYFNTLLHLNYMAMGAVYTAKEALAVAGRMKK